MSTNQKLKTDHKAFAEHIGELRTRVMWVVIAFIVASSLAYYFRDIVVQIALAPIGDQKLVYLTPAGGFAFIFQLTMYVGVVVTAPILIYQLYKFVQPALPRRASRHSLRIMLASTLLMIAGVCFGYFVAVPAALHFLSTFAGTYIEPNLTADSYLNFIVAYVVGLGVLFQLPLLLVFWNWIHPLGPKKLLASERFVILFSFIAAAIMTPTPDPTNQAMVAVPIILIYQVGVVAVLVMNRRQRKKAPKAAVQEAALPVSQQMPAELPVSLPELSATTPEPLAPPVVRRQFRRSIDGIGSVRPTRLQPPTRPQQRLVTNQRPGVTRPGRPGISMDGVSRVFS